MEENKKKGYISIYRSIQEHWIYPNHRKFTKFEAFIDLLLMANYSENKILIDNKLIEIKRGQKLTSEMKLGLSWLWGRDEVRNFLRLLIKDEMILKESNKKFTMITICNYDSYQNIFPTKQQQTNNKTTTDQQQNNINNKDNKVNNNNKDLTLDEYKIKLKENNVTNEGLLSALINYYQMRLNIKKPLTNYGFGLQITRLRKWYDSGTTTSTIIEQINKSIVNRWTDIYEPKDNK